MTRVLFRTDAGDIGLVSGAGTLECLSSGDEEFVSTAIDGELVVAHPLDLFESGTLATWQREIIRRRIVQPFKQAFRELYVLTPAEREAELYSVRFADHTVSTRVAGGLLSARGWSAASSDQAESFKLYPNAGLRADIDWEDAGHFLTETPSATMEAVRFERYPKASDPLVREYVPLGDVPPKIFSEVMRDADLLVSVAAVDGEAYSSPEICVRRGELLLELLQSLGLPGVEIDGHFARVTGSRANYRVHLASGTIHIDPGSYLCVIPDQAVRKKKIYLPFADADDPKLSEIVSKVLLLANDEKITDSTILEQIDRSSKRDA
ncbi:MAG: DUF4132 domain-containing protein [Planctomycetota bacterium]